MLGGTGAGTGEGLDSRVVSGREVGEERSVSWCLQSHGTSRDVTGHHSIVSPISVCGLPLASVQARPGTQIRCKQKCRFEGSLVARGAGTRGAI